MASVGGRSAPATPATDHGPVQEQKDDRADDRPEPGAEIEELVDRVTEAERLGDQAADESPCNADQGSNDEAARIVAGKKRLCDQPSEKSKDDPTDDAHTPPLVFAS